MDLARLAAENAYRYIQGERPWNIVNPDAAEHRRG